MDKYDRLILDVSIDRTVELAEELIKVCGDCTVYDYEKVLPVMYGLSRIFKTLSDSRISLTGRDD